MRLGQPIAMKISDVSVATGISRSKIYELMQAGELPFLKIGRLRRVTPEALQAFLRSKEQRAA